MMRRQPREEKEMERRKRRKRGEEVAREGGRRLRLWRKGRGRRGRTMLRWRR